MKSFSIVAALVVMAGCATTEEKAAVEVARPAEKAVAPETALPKAETFAQTYQRHLRAVRNWSCHSFADQAKKGVPDAMAFIAANADNCGHAGELRELKYRILETLERGRDYETGVAYAEEFLADAKANPSHRTLAANYLAMRLVDAKKDYAGADALYAKLLDEELKAPRGPWTIATLVGYRAALHTLRGDKAGAVKCIESERARIPGNDGFRKLVNGALDEAVGKVYADFYDYRGELDWYLAHGRKDLAFRVLNRSKVSDIPLMDRLSREIVLKDETSAGLRQQAWLWLFTRDEAFCRANLNRCFDKTASCTNSFVNSIGNVLVRANLSEVYGTATPAYYRNPEAVAKLWDVYLGTARGAKLPVDFRAAQYATLAFAELRDKAKAVAAAEAGLETVQNIKSEEAFELKLMAAILRMGGTVDEIAAQTKAAVAKLSAGIPAKEAKRRIERAGSVAVLTGDDTLARGVAKYYTSEVRVTLEKRSYTVRFSDRAIAGAGDWVNLPFKPEESDFTRTYGGGGMSFMTTDVATGDRGNAIQGGAKARQHPTTLQVAADEWGVHFVYTFYDRRARQFESGELDCGSYESYVAPGERQPYACFLSYPRKDARGTVMNTTYDSPGHRRIDTTDPTKYRTDTVFTDDSVVTYTAFSWDVFADHVPVDGGEWDFESVFWGPVPSAWNGTESIHGRSTWGKLRFELGEAARVKILRAQLFKAANAYRAEQKPRQVLRNSVQEGVFSHWSDDELGDPAFYEACLKPLLAELDPVAARVKVGMSDADVKEIAENYLSRFREIRSEVARLRARYLQQRL